jgi:hypothetical protein
VVRVFDVSKVHIATIIGIDVIKLLVYINIFGPAERGIGKREGRRCNRAKENKHQPPVTSFLGLLDQKPI